MKLIGYVYMHRCLNDDSLYIGSSINYKQRWNGGAGYYSQNFFKAIKEIGWLNIVHYVYPIYANCTTEEEADAILKSYEGALIECYKPYWNRKKEKIKLTDFSNFDFEVFNLSNWDDVEDTDIPRHIGDVITTDTSWWRYGELGKPYKSIVADLPF